MDKKYYQAYEERYKTAHQKGIQWSSDFYTPIVMETIKKYSLSKDCLCLEIGCGEGRDANHVLELGYHLIASDISNEAITYCKNKYPAFKNNYKVLDVLADKSLEQYDFIYAVAVVHMLVVDQDRNKFYQFIQNHLKENGIALICSMGDGEIEVQSDIQQAFDLQEREHETGKMLVATTSCRMVSFYTFEREIERNGLEIIEKGTTSAFPDFNCLMFAIVRKMNK